MNYTVLITIGDTNEGIKAVAYGKDLAIVYITAETLSQAQELMKEAESKADLAIKEWSPDANTHETAESLDTYLVNQRENALKDYENSHRGKRFVKELKNSIELLENTDCSQLYCDELRYLAIKHSDSLINGSIDLYSLAYRRGFNKANKEKKNNNLFPENRT